jgi:hypothetical protein
LRVGTMEAEGMKRGSATKVRITRARARASRRMRIFSPQRCHRRDNRGVEGSLDMGIMLKGAGVNQTTSWKQFCKSMVWIFCRDFL